MSIVAKIREGRGPVWGPVKRAARAALHVHLPVGPVTKPLFRLLYGLHVGLREGLAWALRFFWYEPLFRSQCSAVGANFQMEQLPYLSGHGHIHVGDGVRLSGKQSFTFLNRFGAVPELRIGDHTFIGHECGFNLGKSITIGNHCMLASGVRIYDLDGHPLDARRRRAHEPTPPEAVAPVVIEDDVWVGNRAVILKGVRIGARSIVSADSVVRRDVPPDTVVAGNPARAVQRLHEEAAW